MLADLLHTLTEDVRRLLRAGALAAAHDEGLRGRLEALRPVAERVPALAALSAAVERVVSIGEGRATAALLDLLVLLRLVRARLTTAGPKGELLDVPASGPWATPAPAPELYALYDLHKNRYGLNEMRCEQLRTASERGRAADLRHVGPFLELLARGHCPMVELLFREVLPFFARALLPDLLAVMHRHPCLLLAAYRLDREAVLPAAEGQLRRRPGLPALLPRLGPGAVRAFLDELDREPQQTNEPGWSAAAATVLREAGEVALPVVVGLLASEQRDDWQTALRALAALGPAARSAVPTLLAFLADDERAVEVVWTLGQIGTAEVVPHLVRLLDRGEVLRRAVMEALGRIGPPARAAVPALRQLANQWGQRELQLLAMDALHLITRREGGQA
jgi:hypothetical protein